MPTVRAGGFEIAIACPPHGPLADAAETQGIRVVAFDVRGTAGKRRPLGELRDTLQRLLAREQPELLHANSLSMSRLSGPVAVSLRLPSIGHLRDIIKLSRPAVDDLNCHRRLIAVSQATRVYHVAQGLDAERCAVLHNGVDLQQFQPAAGQGKLGQGGLRRELSLPAGARLVVSVGQIGLRKAPDVALAAFRHVAEAMDDVHWLLVGERTSDKAESRELEAGLHEAANVSPLVGRVHFLGTRSDVPRLLADCDLLLHAAHQEPLGRVLLEAAASGLPVVATDVGGTREVFPAGEQNGAVVVPAGDPQAMAGAMLAVLGDADRQAAMSRAARQRAIDAFDLRTAAAKLVAQYHDVLGRS